MRISDWSSDVCSSDLTRVRGESWAAKHRCHPMRSDITPRENPANARGARPAYPQSRVAHAGFQVFALRPRIMLARGITTHPSRSEEIPCPFRSEEHTSALQSLMRISYAVFCVKKQKINN